MKRTDIARRAGKNLRQAKLRTLFTSMAIAVGAFTIMMALAAGEGTRIYTQNLIQSNVNPQVLFVVKDSTLFEAGPTQSTGLSEYNEDSVGGIEGAPDIAPVTQEDVDRIAARDDIEAVQPIYQLQAKYIEFSAKPDTQYTVSNLSMYDPDVLAETAAGSLPERGTDLSAGAIALPDTFATELDIPAEQLVGTEVKMTIAAPAPNFSQAKITELLRSGSTMAEISAKLSGEEKTLTFTVQAVTKQNSMSFSAPNSLLVSSEDAKAIYDFTTQGTDSYGEFFGITAQVKEGIDPTEVKTALEAEGYSAQTVQDLQSLIFTIVNVIQGIVAGFGVLALIASIFGIVNTMYISVLERTSQIGLMRALGMRKRAVAKLFRYEAAWIGFLGGVIGIVLALLAVVLLNPWITSTLDLGDGNTLLAFNWIQAVLLLIGLMIIAIAAGWFPARKAAKLDPIEALRTE